MTVPLSISVGTLSLTTAPYAVSAFSAPAPQMDSRAMADLDAMPDASWWPRDLHVASEVAMQVQVYLSADEDGALTALNTLRQRITSGASLYVKQDAQSDTLERLIKYADIQALDYDTSRTALQGRGYLMAAVTLVCYPYWVGPEVTFSPSAITAVPGTVSVTGVTGEVPALTQLKATHEQAVTAIALGIRSNPASTFATGAVQDYSGTVDANAKGGQVARLTTGTSYAAAGTAANLTVADMRGRYVAWARSKWSAGTTANSARAQSSVTGTAGSATTVNGVVTASPAAHSTFNVENLGELSVPAAEVPTSQTLTGYGAAAAQVTIADASGSYSSIGKVSAYQTFTATAASRLTSVTLRAWNSAETCKLVAGLYATSSGSPTTLIDWAQSESTLGTVEDDRVLTFPNKPVLTAGTQYAIYILVDASSGTSYISKGATTASETAYSSTLTDLGYDLRLIVTAQPRQAFTATTPIQAKATSGTPNYDLDSVTLVPCDEAYVAWTGSATTAGQGILVDDAALRADLVNVYLCDSSGGVGASLLGSVDARNPFLLRPGTNTIVATAGTPGGAAPGALTISGTYRPRYLTLSKGD